MANELLLKRTAFTNVTYPGHASADASTQTGVYIPTGAIVTGIKVVAGGALTDMSLASNATMTPYVGAAALASNNNVISAKVIQTAVRDIGLAATGGVYITAGGLLDIDFGSTHTDATGMTADFDIYVDYLYCNDHD